MKQSVAEILSLRFQYEEIVRNFDIPETKLNGHINSLEWFKKYGNRKNRFRDGYKEAIALCNQMLQGAKHLS